MSALDHGWMATYREQHLRDATDAEIRECEIPRSSLIFTRFGFALLSLALGAAALVVDTRSLVVLLGGLAAGLAAAFWILWGLFAIVQPGPFYDYDKARTLRGILEVRRNAQQARERHEAAAPPPPEPGPPRDEELCSHLHVLGLTETEADGERIRDAYADACLRSHPDKNPGDANAAERFKSVQEAYEFFKARGLV